MIKLLCTSANKHLVLVMAIPKEKERKYHNTGIRLYLHQYNQLKNTECSFFLPKKIRLPQMKLANMKPTSSRSNFHTTNVHLHSFQHVALKPVIIFLYFYLFEPPPTLFVKSTSLKIYENNKIREGWRCLNSKSIPLHNTSTNFPFHFLQFFANLLNYSCLLVQIGEREKVGHR